MIQVYWCRCRILLSGTSLEHKSCHRHRPYEFFPRGFSAFAVFEISGGQSSPSVVDLYDYIGGFWQEKSPMDRNICPFLRHGRTCAKQDPLAWIFGAVLIHRSSIRIANFRNQKAGKQEFAIYHRIVHDHRFPHHHHLCSLSSETCLASTTT